MADIFTNASGNYYGDPLSPLIAAGGVMTTFSGELGDENREPVMSLYSRSGAAAFVLTHQQTRFGRELIEMAAGDEYYVTVTSVTSDSLVSLALADMA
jgi:hypothetical protein